jgi:hypothetical protein
MTQTNITPARWASFTKGQQILMIVSELERVKSRLLKKDNENINPCYERIFELVDLTVEDKKWKNALYELLRFREVVAELYIQQEKDYEMNSIVYNALISMSHESFNVFH